MLIHPEEPPSIHNHVPRELFCLYCNQTYETTKRQGTLRHLRAMGTICEIRALLVDSFCVLVCIVATNAFFDCLGGVFV